MRGCIHAVNLWMSDNIGITAALCCAIGLPQVTTTEGAGLRFHSLIGSLLNIRCPLTTGSDVTKPSACLYFDTFFQVIKKKTNITLEVVAPPSSRWLLSGPDLQ